MKYVEIIILAILFFLIFLLAKRYFHLQSPTTEISEEKHIFLHTYSLMPEKCYFIDDQQENLIGAETCNIKGIFHFEPI